MDTRAVPVSRTLLDGSSHHTAFNASAPQWPNLTPRECEIARLICGGLERAEISAVVKCSPRTYDTHRLHLLCKLGVHNNVQLLRLAIEKGWVLL